MVRGLRYGKGLAKPEGVQMAFTLRREPSPNQNTKFSFLRLPIDLKSVVSERLPQQLHQPVEATRQVFRHCRKQGYMGADTLFFYHPTVKRCTM